MFQKVGLKMMLAAETVSTVRVNMDSLGGFYTGWCTYARRLVGDNRLGAPF